LAVASSQSRRAVLLRYQATQSATSTIPIVFTSGVDLVGDDLVASLARRSGNGAGFSFSPFS
jgi:ABC-type uncharacterized transport system substrate-binding protein